MKATKEDFLNLIKEFELRKDDEGCCAFTVMDFKDYKEFIPEAIEYLIKNGIDKKWDFITGWQTGFERIA